MTLPAQVRASTADRPMRVAFYDHCARMSGAEISMLNTITEMTGADVLVVLGEDGPLVAALKDAGAQVVVQPLPQATAGFSRRSIGANVAAAAQPLAVLAAARRLAGALRVFGPDVIVSNSMKSHVILAAAAPLLRAPVVFHVHDRISTDFMSAGGVRLERAVMRLTGRGVIANSNSTLATVPASRRHRIRVIAGGPIAPLTGDGPAPSSIRARRFGMVGRLTPWKGQDVAVHAFARAFPDGEETMDVVGGPLFGEEEYAAGLVELAQQLGVGDRVRFTGHVDDVYERMRGWDCLVHSSVIPEPFGLVVAQGMLAGVPVVAAAAGGPAEMIEHDRSGWLVPPGDAEALALRLRAVAADAAARARVAAEARVVAQQWLAPEVAVVIENALAVAAGRR